VIYLDSTAVAKLVQREDESGALRMWLDQQVDAPWVGSALLEVEVFRAVMRAEPEVAAELYCVLDMIEAVEPGSAVRRFALGPDTARVSTLGAIHLGTALSLVGITAFVTYDKRLAEAAELAGLPVFSPGAS